MSLAEKIHFKMISFIHDTLYSLFVDPYDFLESVGLEKGQIVLEVGCGPGFFTVPASEIVGEKGFVHTIDINPLAIESVKKKISKAKVKNVKPTEISVYKTDFEEEYFDLVFLLGIIHSLAIDKTVNELYRVLKPNGILTIQKRKSEKIIEQITQEWKFIHSESRKRVILFRKT